MAPLCPQERFLTWEVCSSAFSLIWPLPVQFYLICCSSLPPSLSRSDFQFNECPRFSNSWAHLWFKCLSLRSACWIHTCSWCSSNISSPVKASQLRQGRISCSLCVASVADVCINMCQHGIDGIVADFISLSVSPPRLWASWGQRPWLHHLCIPGIQLRTRYIFNKPYLKEWITRGAVISFIQCFWKVVQGLTVTEIPKFSKNFRFLQP